MSLLQYLRREFAYEAWANREVISRMRSSGGDERTLELMNHINAAARVWLDRLEHRPQSVAVWPTADAAQCEAEAASMIRRWNEFFDRLTEADLTQPISYQNTKGESFTSAVADILTHVILHSAYHRGQIASRTREIGQTPAYTDFIHSVRQGFVK